MGDPIEPGRVKAFDVVCMGVNHHQQVQVRLPVLTFGQVRAQVLHGWLECFSADDELPQSISMVQRVVDVGDFYEDTVPKDQPGRDGTSSCVSIVSPYLSAQ